MCSSERSAICFPSELLWRAKQGFGTPGIRGVVQEARSARNWRDRLARSHINDLNILDRTAVAELLQLHRSGRAERSFQLWNVLNLSVWFDHWIAGEAEPQ